VFLFDTEGDFKSFSGLLSVKPDTLMDMVSCMTEKVGLVHQMPFSCDRTGIPATLEKVKMT